MIAYSTLHMGLCLVLLSYLASCILTNFCVKGKWHWWIVYPIGWSLQLPFALICKVFGDWMDLCHKTVSDDWQARLSQPES